MPMTESPRKGIFCWLYKKSYNKAMKEKKFEKRCPGPIDCFGDTEVLFRKVLIPMAMGDDKKFPPKNGAYRNSLVVYEANGAIYIYSSDGLYTKLSVPSGVTSVNGMYGDVILDIPEKLSQLQNDLGFITNDVDDLTNYTKTSDLAPVALSGSYLDLSNRPAINNGQLTINRNGSTVGSFKANQSQDTTVNIRVPVYTNELINNSQFVVDGNYVHTDNNFSNDWKSKLAGLADIRTIGDNLTLTNGRLDASGGVTPGDISSAIAAHNASNSAHPDIRDEITAIDDLIPNQATTSNQLADKAFVNSTIQTATANFRGNWDNWAQVPTNANDYPADYTGSKTPTVNDYMVIQDASDYTLETLEGTWRFKYTGNWDVDGKAGWHPEYQVNETPLTAAQLAALNSGITASLVNDMALQSDLPTKTSDLINDGTTGADPFATVSQLPTVPTKTSDLTNDGADGTSTYVEFDNYATSSGRAGVIKVGASYGTTVSNTGYLGATTLTAQQYSSYGNGAIVGKGTLENVLTSKGYISGIIITLTYNAGTGTITWSGANSIADIKDAFDAGSTVTVVPPIEISDETFRVCWARYSSQSQLDILAIDDDPAFYRVILVDTGNNASIIPIDLQNKLTAGTGISISNNVISATSSITVDSALSNTSTNPVQNQALYDPIIGHEVTAQVLANQWSEPSGTNPYNSVAIVQLPANSFTDNSLIELLIDDKFQYFAKHGFVLYGHETASQRVWLTSQGKPTNSITFKFRIYNYGS